jgi:hypothetical protein
MLMRFLAEGLRVCSGITGRVSSAAKAQRWTKPYVGAKAPTPKEEECFYRDVKVPVGFQFGENGVASRI